MSVSVWLKEIVVGPRHHPLYFPIFLSLPPLSLSVQASPPFYPRDLKKGAKSRSSDVSGGGSGGSTGEAEVCPEGGVHGGWKATGVGPAWICAAMVG